MGKNGNKYWRGIIWAAIVGHKAAVSAFMSCVPIVVHSRDLSGRCSTSQHRAHTDLVTAQNLLSSVFLCDKAEYLQKKSRATSNTRKELYLKAFKLQCVT